MVYDPQRGLDAYLDGLFEEMRENEAHEAEEGIE